MQEAVQRSRQVRHMTPDPRFLLFGLVALVLTLVVGTLTAYLLAEKELKTLGKVTHTELGTVEYLRQGKGPAVVIVHGSPGGYDQFLTLGTLLSRYGYEVISVSRPGYLRTPLGKNKTPHQQAALIVALLSRLSIKRASIIGISGGGPAAISLAINYPERTSALILIAALSGQAFSNEAGRGDGGLLANDLGFFVAQTFPSHFMSLLGSIEPEDGEVVVSEDERLILASELFRSLGFRSLRNAGFRFMGSE